MRLAQELQRQHSLQRLRSGLRASHSRVIVITARLKLYCTMCRRCWKSPHDNEPRWLTADMTMGEVFEKRQVAHFALLVRLRIPEIRPPATYHGSATESTCKPGCLPSRSALGTIRDGLLRVLFRCL